MNRLRRVEPATFRESSLRPFIKWPGGKSTELEVITSAAPKKFKRFVDPFVGGGSVAFAIHDEIELACNDVCHELIELYQIGKQQNAEFLKLANNLSLIWDQIEIDLKLLEKIRDCYSSEKPLLPTDFEHFKIPDFLSEFNDPFIKFNSEIAKDLNKKILKTTKVSAKQGKKLSDNDLDKTTYMVFKSRIYTDIRSRYNYFRTKEIYNRERTLFFMFLREFAYAAMFRFNSNNEFNVPYGGISYNKKTFKSKIDILFSEPVHRRLENAKFYNQDYRNFLNEIKPNSDDFVFIDPPYDSIFSDYDNVVFDRENQIQLKNCLDNLSSKVMIVIGETEFILNLYKNSNWKIASTDKNYMWNIKSRNDGKARHLVITNY